MLSKFNKLLLIPFAGVIGKKIYDNINSPPIFTEEEFKDYFEAVDGAHVFRSLSIKEYKDGMNNDYKRNTSASLINIPEMSKTFANTGISTSVEKFLNGNKVYEAFAVGGNTSLNDGGKSLFDEAIEKGHLSENDTYIEFSKLEENHQKGYKGMNELIVGIKKPYYASGCPTIVYPESNNSMLSDIFSTKDNQKEFIENINNIRKENNLEPCVCIYKDGKLFKPKEGKNKEVLDRIAKKPKLR